MDEYRGSKITVKGLSPDEEGSVDGGDEEDT